MIHDDLRALDLLLSILQSTVEELRKAGKVPAACSRAEIKLQMLRRARNDAVAYEASRTYLH